MQVVEAMWAGRFVCDGSHDRLEGYAGVPFLLVPKVRASDSHREVVFMMDAKLVDFFLETSPAVLA